MWVRVTIERESWVFWSELSKFVWRFDRNEQLVVLVDLNARVANEVIDLLLNSMECREEIKVANYYARCVQNKSG